MKRFLFAFFLCALYVASPCRADIIPKDMKAIFVRANLTNLAEFDGRVFVKLETLGAQIREKEVIGPDGKVEKGYKLNRLEILAVPKDLFDSAGGLDGLNLLGDPAIIRGDGEVLESGVQLVHRPSDLAGKDLYFKVKIAGGRLVFEKTGETAYKEAPNYVPHLFFYAFAATFILEFFVFLILVKGVFRSSRPGWLRSLLCVFAAQIVSLPLLWFIITHYALMGTFVMLAAESFAVGVETLIYRYPGKLSWRRAFTASFACNLASYIIGLAA